MIVPRPPTTICLSLDRRGRVCVHIDGPLRLVVDRQSLARMRRIRNESESSDGFWDYLKGGLKTVANIANTPLVKAALQKYVPFGGVALTAVQTASVALDMGSQVLAKHPKTTALVQNLRDSGRAGVEARNVVAFLKENAKRGDAKAAQRLAKIGQMASLLDDMTALTKVL